MAVQSGVDGHVRGDTAASTSRGGDWMLCGLSECYQCCFGVQVMSFSPQAAPALLATNEGTWACVMVRPEQLVLTLAFLLPGGGRRFESRDFAFLVFHIVVFENGTLCSGFAYFMLLFTCFLMKDSHVGEGTHCC